MNFNRIYKTTIFILTAVICIVSVLYLLNSVKDPDFFWHLKTGEWIWQHKSLPTEDPFAYTSPQTHTTREHFILTSYWVSQILYHLFHLLFGMPGIVFLRFIVVGILFFFMLKRRHGDNILYLSLLLVFIIQLLDSYPIERPHVFSFLCFAILLYFLEGIKEDAPFTKRKGIYLFLPILMVIWANMHGGYILGQVIIILYIMIEGLKFVHPSLRPLGKSVYKNILIIGGLGIIFSLVNPNTYEALTIMIKMPASLTINNLEFQSSLWRFRELNEYRIILYWFVLLLTVTGVVINLKKIDITEIALLAGTGYFSFTTVRYIPFFIIAALPVIARYFSNEKILKLGRIFIFVAALYAAVFFAWKERLNIENISSNRWINTYEFPVTATDFIVENNIKGNIYNNFEWGGYLIWRLGPERKVFIDGRVLFEDVYETSKLIDKAYADNYQGLPYWRSVLNSYGVSYIIIPLVSPSGTVPELLNALLRDNDWIPVFLDKNAMIFLKDSAENSQTISHYSVPKKYFILG